MTLSSGGGALEQWRRGIGAVEAARWGSGAGTLEQWSRDIGAVEAAHWHSGQHVVAQLRLRFGGVNSAPLSRSCVLEFNFTASRV